MEIFGVGIFEIILILVIAVIVLGPDGMVKSARSVGVWLRKVIKSPLWAQLMDTQRELRDMPTRLVREAGLEEDLKELKKTQQQLKAVDISGGLSKKQTPATLSALLNKAAGENDAKSPLSEDEQKANTIAPPELKPEPPKNENPIDPGI